MVAQDQLAAGRSATVSGRISPSDFVSPAETPRPPKKPNQTQGSWLKLFTALLTSAGPMNAQPNLIIRRLQAMVVMAICLFVCFFSLRAEKSRFMSKGFGLDARCCPRYYGCFLNLGGRGRRFITFRIEIAIKLFQPVSDAPPCCSSLFFPLPFSLLLIFLFIFIAPFFTVFFLFIFTHL